MNNKRGFFDDSEYYPKKDPTESLFDKYRIAAKTISQTTQDMIKSQKTDNSPPDIMAEIESFPEITYELPEGDNRKIKQWWIDKTDNGYHVCLSIEESLEKRLENAINLYHQTHQPETIAIPVPELRNIVDALEAGLEHTQTVLSEHDASLGRTTRKNKNWAESLEKDIEFSKAQIKFLKLKLVGASTHYP